MGPKRTPSRESKGQSEHEEASEQVKAEQEKQRLAYKKTVSDLKKGTWVKVSLKMLNESSAEDSRGRRTKFDEEKHHREIAEKIASQVFVNKKSLLKTSNELKKLSFELNGLAFCSDILTERFPKKNESLEHKEIRIQKARAKRLWPSPPDSPQPQHVVRYPENILILQLSAKIAELSDEYYNKHPIEENPSFEKDDDKNATPGNLFVWKRITDWVSTVPDDNAKYRYLLNVKRKLMSRDASGEIRSNCETLFSGDRYKDLHRKLDDQIAIYGKTASINKETQKSPDFNLRRKIMIFVALVFRELEIPTSKYTSERIVELFVNLFGGDKKTVREILDEPYRHNSTNKQSIKRLRLDAEFVRSQLDRAGFDEAANLVISELDEIGKDQTNFDSEDHYFDER